MTSPMYPPTQTVPTALLDLTCGVSARLQPAMDDSPHLTLLSEFDPTTNLPPQQITISGWPAVTALRELLSLLPDERQKISPSTPLQTLAGFTKL